MLRKILFIAIFLICITAFIGKETAFAVTAEENYKFYCAQCHGMDGKGEGANAKPKAVGIDLPEMSVTPRNHTSPEDMNKLTDTDIENAISGGGASVSKSTIMPPWGKTLTDAEIKDLTAYLRKLCKCKG
ncbi:MAG: cytochrome c, partial [Deltaproteobacteria bacterium]|nr:cytochrome c [Deltaproteobacteria bacterium]